MSSLRQNSNSVDDQKIGPNEHYGEVGHVTNSINHECGQVCDSMSSEDVVLYVGCYHVHLKRRMKLTNHHKSVWYNLVSHGLHGDGGMAK